MPSTFQVNTGAKQTTVCCLGLSEKAPGFWSRLLTSDLSLPVAAAAAAKLLQSCPTLCDPIDSIDGSAVPGILQARTLERVAISFSITSRY